uniref:LRRC8 pannexin-like TM region domain-containing protein n=1 Tax=Fundulus heteroclitus TaxID=8078 RepID=A0A3Q2P9A5_FUNHE
MFSLSELAPLDQHQNTFKLPKPWWEVFMDYLVVLMLLTSVLACTEQLSRDRVVCIPSELPFKASSSGRRTHLVYQQYVYISQVCYHEALPLCSRFFPYMALLQSLVLVASGSFWLHFPHTSSRIEQFLSILAKCCESPWTSQALSQAARQENIQDLERQPRRAPMFSAGFSIPATPSLRLPPGETLGRRQATSYDQHGCGWLYHSAACGPASSSSGPFHPEPASGPQTGAYH